jgi:hypothetical protein
MANGRVSKIFQAPVACASRTIGEVVLHGLALLATERVWVEKLALGCTSSDLAVTDSIRRAHEQKENGGFHHVHLKERMGIE